MSVEPNTDGTLYARLEAIVAACIDPSEVPSWQWMVDNLRNEPRHPDPPTDRHGITALPWASALDGWLGRQCRSRRDGRGTGGRCELRRGHRCDHARDQGMFPLRWADHLTNPPLVRLGDTESRS